MNIPLNLFATLLLLFCLSARAQQTTPAPSIPSTGFAGLDQYRASRIAVFTDDYGQLSRYREANAKLGPPAAGENRIVFFGDSITDIWKLPDYFPGKPYVNRGIGGQTTPQMLVRFRQDVIDLESRLTTLPLPNWRAHTALAWCMRRCFRSTTTPSAQRTSLPSVRCRAFWNSIPG